MELMFEIVDACKMPHFVGIWSRW